MGYIVLVSIPTTLGLDTTTVRLASILVLVSIGFIAILVIGAWIGYTMATTPPPKPTAEITAEAESKAETHPETGNQAATT